MPEIFATQAIIHVQGRQLGLQYATSGITGASSVNGPKYDLLTGPDAMRQETTTANTTAANIKAVGTAWLQGTSAASSAVYTIDPPIPGIRKTLIFSVANGPLYVKTANGETFISSMNSTMSVLKGSSFGGVVELQGVTTAIWAVLNVTSGTSANASSFAFTTTT